MFLLKRLTASTREKEASKLLNQVVDLNQKIDDDREAHLTTLRAVGEEITRLNQTQEKLAKLIG